MSGPLDTTLKHLTEISPRDWVVRGGWAAPNATVIDADIATIAGAADKVICVGGTRDWLLATDFHAGHDSVAKLPDLLLYNSALFRRHDLLVRSLLVLLHPGADSPQLNGVYERGFDGEPPDVTLRYHVLRVWEVPADDWLSGGVGLVPLAPLGKVQPKQLPALIAKMRQRLEREVPAQEVADLWSAAYILMGTRYDQAVVQNLLQGVRGMKESVTYQAILEEGKAEGKAEGEAKGKAEGKAEEARRLLLMLGSDQFGAPSADAQAALEAMTDVPRLEHLVLQVKHAASWQALLAASSPRRRPARRRPSS